jgi:hypothetical protein
MICQRSCVAGPQRRIRYLWLALAVIGGCSFEKTEFESARPRVQENRVAPQHSAVASTRLVRDLDEHSLQQLCDAKSKAVVFIFTRTECPIANRYAPEIRRLYEKFAPQGISFQLVYPETSDSAEAIREHLSAYEYPCDAWRDPAHVGVRRFGAKVTPEVAVFACRRRHLVYQGRIDDLYVDFGQARRAPTTHDLEDVLDAVLAARPIRLTTTAAVGCLISELP